MQQVKEGLQDRLMNIGIRLGINPKIDGFIVESGTYRVDPVYKNAERTFKVMPVAPEYGIVSGVRLLGSPIVVVHEELAESPRDMRPPKLSELTDVAYYRAHIMSEALSAKGISQNEQNPVSSPVEIRPYATTRPYATNDFGPVIYVQYTHAIQRIQSKKSGVETSKGALANAFRNGTIRVDEPAGGLFKGLAYVAHVRVPVDLRTIFPTPKAVDDFKGNLSLTAYTGEGQSKLSRDIFVEYFRSKFEQIGKQIEAVRNTPLKGILLSRISVQYRIADHIMTLGADPKGELVMAASYLV